MVGFSAGAANAAFEVRGADFDPHAALTVTLTGLDPANNPILNMVSKVRPVVGPGGTFSFAISRVYHGGLAMGMFTVEVREPNGHAVSTEFMVLPPGVP